MKFPLKVLPRKHVSLQSHQTLQKAVHSKGNFKGAASATAAGGAAFMASKQFNNFMKDQIEENFGDGEGVADWLGDLF